MYGSHNGQRRALRVLASLLAAGGAVGTVGCGAETSATRQQSAEVKPSNSTATDDRHKQDHQHQQGRGHWAICPAPDEDPEPPPVVCDWEPYNDGLAGGRVDDAQFDPRQPGRVYATSGRRLYVSTDSGATWSLGGEAPYDLGQLAFPPGDPESLVVASTSGLLVSSDGGAGWEIHALRGVRISTIHIHPAEPRRWYAAVAGAGVLRSNDEGSSWAAVNQGIPYSQVLDLSGDPRDPDRVIASFVELNSESGWTERGGLLATADGGRHWSVAYQAGGRSRALHRCATDPDKIWSAQFDAGLASSLDGGLTWAPTRIRGAMGVDVAVVGDDCNTVYALSWITGPWRSTDGGASWDGPLNEGLTLQPRSSPRTLAVAPSAPQHVFAASSGGLFRSIDGSDTWSLVTGPGQPDVRNLVASPTRPSEAWIASWGIGVSRRSSPAGAWERVPLGLLPLDYTMGIGLQGPSTVLVGGQHATWLSRDDGESFEQVARWVNYYDFDFHPHDPGYVLAATQNRGVLLSTDGGATWASSNGGLTAWPTGIGTGIDVRAVLFDDTDPQQVVIGTFGRGMFHSADAGVSWQSAAPSVAEQRITTLASDGSGFYGGVEGLGVIRGVPGGAWDLVSAGLPSLAIHDLEYDSDERTLYAATGAGVFELSSSGEWWQRVGADCIPESAVENVAIISGDFGRRLLAASKRDGIFSYDL